MALRYLLIHGPGAETNEAAREVHLRDSGLQLAFQAPGCRLWTNEPGETVRFENGHGAIIGFLFRGTADAVRVVKLSAAEASKVGDTAGRSLFEDFWGSYVAVLPEGKTLDVVRDPSGAMPCYDMRLNKDGTRVLFSDLETLRAAGFTVPGVDWSELTRHLIAFDLRTERTSLAGVTEVLAGTRVRFRGAAREVDAYWSPATFARQGPDLPETELPGRLYQTVTAVVPAWASLFERPLLGVSGGLDSSIVAASLKKASRRFTAVTMATDEGDGDERKYARALGEHLGLDLVERFHRLEQVDVTTSLSGHLPRPLLMAFGQSELAQKLELTGQLGVDSFFSGIGGDNVFCNIKSASPFIDRLRREGIGSGPGRTLRDIGTLTGASHIEILVGAAKRLLAASVKPWFTNGLFLSDNAHQLAKGLRQHPWLEDVSDLGPGKLAHIAMLARIQGTIDGYSRMAVPTLVNPLLSQPLVEFCLSVPSWNWIAGGENRSIARRAFESSLPDVLLKRTSKGTPNSFAFEVVDRNRKRLRDHLLHGRLAQHGLLDIAAIEEVLRPDQPMKGFSHMRLSFLAEAESWSRLQN